MADLRTLISHLMVICLGCFTFTVAYKIGDCGGTFTELNGVFYSPDYPKNYPKNTKCKYKFKTGHPVTISCDKFDLQSANKKGVCKKDYVKIDGTKYCGSSGPNYIADGKTLTVMFKSNKKTQGAGFRCRYHSGDATTTSLPTTTPVPPTTTPNPETTTENLADLFINAVSLHNSGTCYTGARSTCGCSSVSYQDSEFYTTTIGDYRIVATNGIPYHIYEVGQEHANPNNACPHELYMAVPKNPTKGDTFKSFGMGIVGLSVSGGFYFNHLSSPDGSVAVVEEGESFDSCNGHSDQSCRYHYHEIPLCIVGGEGNCTMAGYQRDGFAVYTFCDHETEDRYLLSCYQLNAGEDGSNESHYTYNTTAYDNGDCDLDYANGYTFSDNRGYAYIFTEDFPFLMPGYYGTELADLCYITES